MKTVAKYGSVQTAQLLCARLISLDIPAMLVHLGVSQDAVCGAGVEVVVPDQFFDDSMQILSAIERGDFEVDEQDTDPGEAKASSQG